MEEKGEKRKEEREKGTVTSYRSIGSFFIERNEGNLPEPTLYAHLICMAGNKRKEFGLHALSFSLKIREN